MHECIKSLLYIEEWIAGNEFLCQKFPHEDELKSIEVLSVNSPKVLEFSKL